MGDEMWFLRKIFLLIWQVGFFFRKKGGKNRSDFFAIRNIGSDKNIVAITMKFHQEIIAIEKFKSQVKKKSVLSPSLGDSIFHRN